MRTNTPVAIVIGVIILIVLGIGLFFATGSPVAKTEVRDTGSEIKQLGRDAADGVKDAYDTTKDAAHEAQQEVKDAVK